MIRAFLIAGQSNGVGSASDPYTCTSGADAWRLNKAGVWEPRYDTDTGVLVPQDGLAADSIYDNAHGSDGLYSFEGAMLDTLAAELPGDTFVFINCARSGSASSAWVAGLTTSPPPQSLSGTTHPVRLKHAARAALRDLGISGFSALIYWQGETDALASTVAAWGTNTRAVLTEFASFLPWDHTMKFILIKLCPTAPDGATAQQVADWEAIRDDCDAIAGERSDTTVIDPPDSPKHDAGLHLAMGTLGVDGHARLGQLCAEAYISGFV